MVYVRRGVFIWVVYILGHLAPLSSTYLHDIDALYSLAHTWATNTTFG